MNSQNYNRYSYCLNNPLKYTDPSGEQYYYDYDRQCYVDAFGNRADYSDVYKNMFQSGYFRGGNAAFSTYGWNPPFVMGGSGGTTSENAQQKLNQYIELLEVLGVKVTKGNAHANYIWLSFAYQLSPTAEDVSNNILGAAVTEGFKYYYGNNVQNGLLTGFANSATGWDIASLGLELNQMALVRGLSPADKYAVSLYRALGGASKAAGAFGTGAGVAGLWLDYNSMKAGYMCSSRFGYHLTGFGVSVGVGSAYGGVPGALAGGLFWAGETIYDNIIIPAAQIWWQIDQGLSNPNFYIK